MSKYTKEWQPYDHDYGYDKQEYDIKTYDGAILLNCYPNAGIFRSFNPVTPGREQDEKDVVSIRLSEKEVLEINY